MKKKNENWSAACRIAVLLTGFRKDHTPAWGYPDARTGGKCIPVTTASANWHPSSSFR